jgi:hypothetical protein
MALLEEWILPGPINDVLAAKVDGVLRKVLPESLERSVPVEDAIVRIVVRVPHAELEALALRLDAPLDHFDGWEWREEIDALESGDVYTLWVECARKVPETFEASGGAGEGAGEGELPILSVYSKDGDNMAGWPVAFVLASRLARELGGWEPEMKGGEAN